MTDKPPTTPVWIARPIAWRLEGRRGPRRHFDSLVSRMAELRTCMPGGGGHWSGDSGNGAAWHHNSDRTWTRERQIRRGQFVGSWRYKRASEI